MLTHLSLGVWVAPTAVSFPRNLLPEMASGLLHLKGPLASPSPQSLLTSPQAPDFCPRAPGFCLGLTSVSPPTARGSGGPQDSPLQGEDLQEGEALWYLPTGHHSGGLHLQR